MGFRGTDFLTPVPAFTLKSKAIRIVRLRGTIVAITGKAVFSAPETAGASGKVSAIIYIAKDGKRRACSLSRCR